MIADYSPPPPMRTPRLYFLRTGKRHAPVEGSAPIPMPRCADHHDGKAYFSILDMRVRIEPSGDDWGDQQGRTVSFIVNWFTRYERKFPNDPDRYWYIWGWESD